MIRQCTEMQHNCYTRISMMLVTVEVALDSTSSSRFVYRAEHPQRVHAPSVTQ
jgi:hypothetical protein